MEIEEEDSDELVDANCRLTIGYTQKFKRVRASTPFVVISGESGFLILTPVRYWSFLDDEYSSGGTKEIELERSNYEDKLTSPRPDDDIIQETWKYATKSGGKDMRYKDNASAFLVQRYGVALLLQNGSRWELGGLLEEKRDRLLEALQEITGHEIAESEDNLDDEEYDETDDDNQFDDQEEDSGEEPWYEVLGVAPDATEGEIKAAYREKIKQYHSDRVSGLGEKLQIFGQARISKVERRARRRAISAEVGLVLLVMLLGSLAVD